MEEQFRAYMTFLETLRQALETLTALAAEKIKAVSQDDLIALDEVLRQEQAQALHFRGLDQTREKLLKEMGLQGASMSKVSGACPPAMKQELQRATAALQAQYQTYQEQSGQARALLEKNLREVESTIAAMGAAPPSAGPGYGGPDAQIPNSMKTDFRA